MAKNVKHDNELLEKLRKLHGLLGSANPHEREVARQKIDEILRRNRKTWNDLTALLFGAGKIDAEGWDDDDIRRTTDIVATGAAKKKNAGTNTPPELSELFDILAHLLQEYVGLKPHEYVAIALWILHSHIFDKFMISPRLALLSAVRGVGKTTLLDCIRLLAAKTAKTDNATPAWIYHHVDRHRGTLLVDEADNLGLATNGILRAVFNSGHRRGGKVSRLSGGQPRDYSTFCPLAIGAIGSLPLPLLHRAIVIHMERHDGTRKLRRFDENDIAEFNDVFALLCMFTRDLKLNTNPPLPVELRNRVADNWRPLIAIADAFCRGEEARLAAIEFAKQYHDEDIPVILLHDIRTIFNTRGVDRLLSAVLVNDLNAMDDALWSEWRGLKDDQQPRKLTQAQLAAVLNLFRIRPRTTWPLNRRPGDKSGKGYLRSQFEKAWRSYCSEDGTPSQPSSSTQSSIIRYPRRP